MKYFYTLDDLFRYFSSTSESAHFSASTKDDYCVVQVPGVVKFESDADKAKDGLTSVVLKSCHTELNLNKSYISEEVMSAALPSFSNRPILGYIHNVDGKDQFYNHAMHLDDDGEVVYDEKCVGIIPESCNAHMEYDDVAKKNYVVVNGYIFDEYSKAKDIIERDGELSVSVELSLREYSYNAKEKYLNIEDFFFSGVTILGVDEDGNQVKPGMSGSTIKLADFSKEHNSVFSAEELEIMQGLKESLDVYMEKAKEGGNGMSKLDELMQKYGVESVDALTFEYENLTDDELVAAFESAFAEAESEEGETDVEMAEEEAELETNSEAEPAEAEVPESAENFTKTFELSHDDIRVALYALLSSYEEADNEWYFISAVYDDHFAYESWDGSVVYGQKYKKEEDNVSFDGERYQLHRELLTDSEYTSLQEMRSNYSQFEEMKAKLEKYEAEPDKMEIIDSADYSLIKEVAEFEELRNNHFDLSVADVKAKADEILLNEAKKGNLNFTEESHKEIGNKRLPNSNKKISRYGDLFKK